MHADQVERRLDAGDAQSVDDLRRERRELILGPARRRRVTACAPHLALVHARGDSAGKQRHAEDAAPCSALERRLERRPASRQHRELG
jgi:hypothetical protein